MTDRYSIISQESIGWASPVSQVAMDASCISINDDSYVTAEEDNCDESQYLSVLDSTARASLELHDVTLSHSKIVEEQHELLSSDDVVQDSQEQQVVIFTVEGSDDLFGIQVAQDEEGNLKKYQFQLRTTEDGQLEAMPETIQLVAEENVKDESAADVFHDTRQEAETSQNGEQTPLISHYSESEVFIEGGALEGAVTLNPADTKVGVLENGLQLLQINMQQNDDDRADGCLENDISVIVKGENLDEQNTDDIFEELVEYTNENDENLDLHQELVLDPEEVKQEMFVQKNSVFQEMFDKQAGLVENGEHLVESATEFADNETPVDENEVTVLEYQNYEADETVTASQEEIQSPMNVENYASLFMEAENIEFVHESESDDAETYEAVKHIHVTAETVLEEDLNSYETEETAYQQIDPEPLTATTANALSGSLTKIMPKKTKPVLYYLMENHEKENVNSVPLKSVGKPPVKTHPRSVLKGDMDIRLKPQLSKADSSKLRLAQPPPEVKPPDHLLPLSDKRFARSKRAVEERLFHNFINRTTIPHAPVRQTRLPRKQEIKPVDNRRDEEIIVQEVMVSSNGFIENREERLSHRDKKTEVPTIELSDSEEENPSGRSTTLHRRRKMRTSSSGSNASADSVIEIVPSDEESRTELTMTMPEHSSMDTKRSRDKTPDGVPTTPETCVSPTKRSRNNDHDPPVNTDKKKEFTCPHCPKTFPSENSLSTHIQHHNLENSMFKNKTSTTAAKNVNQPVQYKHICDKCKKSFKNSILLSRHACQAKTTTTAHKCNVCLKTFQDVVMFNIHKKSHTKQNMVTKTSNISICPTKYKSPVRKSMLPRFNTSMAPPRNTISRPSTSRASVRPSPKRTSTQVHQCSECQKVCSSLDILNVHEKSHKKFNCVTCKSSFASRILLDQHLRMSCVKTASPKLRRLSFKVRRSSVRLSRAPVATATKKAADKSNNSRLSKIGTGSKALNLSTMKSEPLDMQAKCDECDKTFRTLTAMFKHKVKDHGMHTPDKKFMQEEKKKLYRPLPAHCGIPAPEKLRKIWGMLEDATKNKPVS